MAAYDTHVRFVSPSAGVTVGVDVGTTSVKALAVDDERDGRGAQPGGAQRRAPEPDILRHDAKRAWRAGPAASLRRR